RYALWLSPLPHLNLEANYHDDSAATEGWGVAMRFTMKLHDPHATRRAPFFADQPYEMASMRSHQLDPLY
ncbi:MAG TPA: hypothetical protein VE631_03615, partial [Alphaproteobacteria bacterium]|nr:hypothetical protein [Alphaproteobacteria bacterium]